MAEERLLSCLSFLYLFVLFIPQEARPRFEDDQFVLVDLVAGEAQRSFIY